MNYGVDAFECVKYSWTERKKKFRNIFSTFIAVLWRIHVASAAAVVVVSFVVVMQNSSAQIK